MAVTQHTLVLGVPLQVTPDPSVTSFDLAGITRVRGSDLGGLTRRGSFDLVGTTRGAVLNKLD
jgi:hypothetical protein